MAVSFSFFWDSEGFNGAAATIGPGAGIAFSDTDTNNNGLVNKTAKFLAKKIDELLNGKKTEPYEYVREQQGSLENYDKNVEDIMNGDLDPSQINLGVNNPITMQNADILPPNTTPQPEKKKDKEEKKSDKGNGSSNSSSNSNSSNDTGKDEDPRKYDGNGDVYGL